MKTYVLELDGKLAGTLSAVRASSLTISSKENGVLGKAASPGEIVIALGTGMSAAFYKWLGSFGGVRKNGAIIIIDGGKSTRIEFSFALISQIVFPELGTSNSSAGSIQVTLRPEVIKFSSGAEKIDLGVYAGTASSWVVKNFKFRLDGFNTNRVYSVSSLTWGQKIIEESQGNARVNLLRTGSATISSLTFSLPLDGADPLRDWFNDFAVKGNMRAGTKSAEITYLSSNLKSEYFAVQLKEVGPYSLKMDRASVTIAIYIEDLSFTAGAAAIK